MALKIYFSVVPHFKPTELKDFPNYEILIGKLPLSADKTVTVEMVKSKKSRGDFLPAKIKHGQEIIWDFKDEFFKGLCKLVYYQKKYFIAFISQYRIVRVLPLTDLPVIRAKTENEVIYLGATPPKELYQFKIAIAKQLRLDCLTNDKEKDFIKKERDFTEKQKQEKREFEKKLRRERLKKLFVRPEIFAYDIIYGQKVRGTPATETEWPCLPHGQAVVLVDFYNQHKRQASQPLEAFLVNKTKGGQVSKKNPKKVSGERPLENQVPKSIGAFKDL